MREKASIKKQKAIVEFNKVIYSLQEEITLNGYVLNSPIWDNLLLDDMPNEIWTYIPNYDGYEISNYSRVKSLPKKGNAYKEIILQQAFNTGGYLYVTMNKKKETVHRVSGFSFLYSQMTPQKNQINHKKGFKWYNLLFNLEWTTPGDNQRHAFTTGLKIPQYGKQNVASIPIIQFDLDGKYIREWESMKMAARELDIDDAPIAKCCRGNINYTQAYGYIWRYKKDIKSRKGARLSKDQFLIKNKPKFAKRRATTNRLKSVA